VVGINAGNCEFGDYSGKPVNVPVSVLDGIRNRVGDDIKIVYGNTIKIKHVKKLRKKLYALKETENIVFVHGIGKRKTSLQKSIETLESYLNRLKKYNQQIHICAERNSYSKTDHDATFM